MAKVFSVIPGLEILYFNKECSGQKQYIQSELCSVSSSIVIQKSITNEFCMIYQVDKNLPASILRYGCDMAVMINAEMLHFEDIQLFPEIWEFVQGMKENFKLEKQFCLMKYSSEIKGVFEELCQIPLPPTMFRFYMLLKALELLLYLSNTNLYSTQVHFYPYEG